MSNELGAENVSMKLTIPAFLPVEYQPGSLLRDFNNNERPSWQSD
jgi:hypothetical protein